MGVLDFINTGLQAGAQIFNQINQREQWRREDTAVQRRVRDLQAAGLSPVLAAGSAASSSAPIRVEAPQFSSNVEAQGVDIKRQNAGIAQTKADTDLKKVQYLKEINDIAPARLNSYIAGEKNQMLYNDKELSDRYIAAQLNREMDENEEVSRNLEIYRHYKVPSIGSAGDDIIAGQQMLKNLFPNLDTKKGSGITVLERLLVPLISSFVGRK